MQRPGFFLFRIITLTFVTILLCSGCQQTKAQKAEATQEALEQPQIEQELPLIYPDSEASELDHPMLVLGWSLQGHFAWMERQAREASDEDYYRFFIQDLKSDSQLVAKRFVFPAYIDFSQAVVEKEDVLRADLDKYQIREHRVSVALFPAVFGQYREYYVVPSAVTTTGIAPSLGFEGIATCEVFLVQNGKKRKRIDKRDFGDYYPLALSVAGYLKSPYEDRIAVLMCQVDRGWEGPPNARRFYVIGAGVAEQF